MLITCCKHRHYTAKTFWCNKTVVLPVSIMLGAHTHKTMCFDAAVDVAFVVDGMTSQNCIYMAFCDR